MPFTLAHVAAVLPLRAGRTGAALLPTAPLVAASMVPDLPALLGAPSWRPVTHTLWAVPTLDVVLTGLACAVWAHGLREVVTAAVPGLARRWAPSVDAGEGRFALGARWYLAAVVGGLTHVLWDALTHGPDGPAPGLVAYVGRPHLELAVELACSAVGVLAAAVWTLLWWRRRTPAGRPAPEVDRRWAVPALAVVVVFSGGWAAWRGIDVPLLRAGRYGDGIAVGQGLFGSVGGLAVAAVALAAAHRVRLAWRRSQAGRVRDQQPSERA